MRPFRFAVQGTNAESAIRWRDLARKAEDLGYSTLFVADHYLGPSRAAEESLQPPQHLAPITALAWAAAHTETLRIGSRVFCIDYHVPAVLAKEAATLDLLSDGRLEFGIGAGWYAAEYDAMGVPFAESARRVDKLEQVVALVKAHWAGGELAYEGKLARASGYRPLPLPIQKPHPPIMIGGARKRVLSLAAREADIVSIANVPWAPVNHAGLTPAQEVRRRIRFVRDMAGARFVALDLEISPYFSEITEHTDDAVDRLVARMPESSPEIVRDHPNVLVGSVDEVVECLQDRRERLGFNYITIPLELLDSFAPVVERLVGR